MQQIARLGTPGLAMSGDVSGPIDRHRNSPMAGRPNKLLAHPLVWPYHYNSFSNGGQRVGFRNLLSAILVGDVNRIGRGQVKRASYAYERQAEESRRLPRR